MTGKRPKIAVIFQSGWASVDALASTIAAILGERYEVDTLPSYFPALPAREQELVLKDLLRSAAAVVGTATGYWAELREALQLPVRWLFLPLGDMPRGAYFVRKSLPLMRATDILAFNSTADQRIYEAMVSRSAPRVAQLPLYVDASSFRPCHAARRTALRARLGIAPDEVVFLYVGRVTAEKNLHGLIALMLDQLAANPKLRFMLVGKQEDLVFGEFGTGPYDMSLMLRKLAARRPEVADRLTLLPEVRAHDLPGLYGAADVFVNLTLHHDENFGVAQVEAMASGLPVIGTRWGGLKDTIRHGETGFQVDTWLTDWGIRVDMAAARRHCEALASDAALRERLGRRAREVVLETYALPRFAANLHALVDALLEPAGVVTSPSQLSPMATELDVLTNRVAPWMWIFDDATYHYYEWLIGPYCSGRPPAIGTSDIVAPAGVFVTQRGRRLSVRDPIWPRDYDLTACEARVLRFLRAAVREAHGAGLQVEALHAQRRLGAVAEIDRAVAHLVTSGLLVRSPRPD